MYYPGGSQSAHIQFHVSQPAAVPTNYNYSQGLNTQSHGGFTQYYPVPRNASPDDEYFCRELDGTHTLRTINTIMNHLNPGQWAQSPSGELYWHRHAKS